MIRKLVQMVAVSIRVIFKKNDGNITPQCSNEVRGNKGDENKGTVNKYYDNRKLNMIYIALNT